MLLPLLLAVMQAQDPWPFRPLSDAKPPAGVDHPVDAFVDARLEKAGIKPAGEADRRTLLRRVTFDLVGLPPSPGEIEAFLGDRSEGAYERVVDRLLESPRYGERRARFWLDLVRYSDSDGFKADVYRPHIWRYRDYVIRSFNEDKPYDRFVQEQIAGDEMFPEDPTALVATGYLRLWPYEDNQSDAARQWRAILDDVTENAGEVFLAVGLRCAKCHDHKYDPIPRKDYYRLRAFFAPFTPRTDLVHATTEQRAEYAKKRAAWESATADLRAEMAKLKAPHWKAAADKEIKRFPEYLQEILWKTTDETRTPWQRRVASIAMIQVNTRSRGWRGRLKGEAKTRYGQLEKELKAFDKIKPKELPRIMGVTDLDAIPPEVAYPGEEGGTVKPLFLSALGGEVPEIRATKSSTGRRTALARWLTRPDHPLTTRVIVNRIWQEHFGVGIVPTPNDFGKQGVPPTHPKMLDWLARTFVSDGASTPLGMNWSFKKMHRLIVTSAAYRRESVHSGDEHARATDPDNTLLWRQRVRRLDADQIRDAMLAVSGKLDLRAGGVGSDQNSTRRSIFVKLIRNKRPELMEAFDGPDTFNSCSRRQATTSPTQALLLINGKWTLARARDLAARAKSANGAWRLALGRLPAVEERWDAEQAALVDLCHVLLNSNEFLYVD